MATTVESNIHIEAPVERVWSALMDPALMPEWLTNFKQIKLVSGSHGEVGSKSELTFVERGKELVVQEEVVKVEEKSEYAFKMETPDMFSYNRVKLAGRNGATQVRQIVEFHPQGWFIRILMPFLKSTMKQRMEQDLENLKKLVEAEN